MALPKTLGSPPAPAPEPEPVLAPGQVEPISFVCDNYPSLSFSHPQGKPCPDGAPAQFHRGMFRCTTEAQVVWMEECIAAMAIQSRGLIRRLDRKAAEEVAKKHQAAVAAMGGAVRGPITSAMIESMRAPVTAARLQQDGAYMGAKASDVNAVLESLGQVVTG